MSCFCMVKIKDLASLSLKNFLKLVFLRYLNCNRVIYYYRTAAWHVNADQKQLLSVLNEDIMEEDPETRFRRCSTGSAKFSGVA